MGYIQDKLKELGGSFTNVASTIAKSIFSPDSFITNPTETANKVATAGGNLAKEVVKSGTRAVVSGAESIPRLGLAAIGTGLQYAKPIAKTLEDISPIAKVISQSVGENVSQFGKDLRTTALTQELPTMNIPGLGNLTSYQTESLKDIKAGMNPILSLGKTAFNIAVDEPVGVVFKPVFAVGSLIAKQLADKGSKVALETIAKSDIPEVIERSLKKFHNFYDDTRKSELVTSLVGIKNEKEASELIQDTILKDAYQKTFEATGKTPEAARTLADELIEFNKSKQQSIPTNTIPDAPLKERTFPTKVDMPTLVKDKASSFYKPQTNAETAANAKYLVDNHIDEAYKLIANDAPATAITYDVARQLSQRISAEARALEATNPSMAAKLWDDYADIIDSVAKKATTQGQAIQALSMWSRSTPDGFMAYVKKTINKANELLPKNKKIEFDGEIAKKFSEKFDKVSKIVDDRERIIETAVLMRDVAQMIPKEAGRVLSTIQTMFQLLNPKTTVRNIIGNLGFNVAENVSSIFASALDAIIPGKKVIGMPSIAGQIKSGTRGFKSGLEEALKGIDTTGMKTQFDIPQTPTFIGKDGKLNEFGAVFEKALNVTLRAPDRAFYQATFDDEIARMLKASGKETPTTEMIDEAAHTAMYRTFQDDNITTALFTGAKALMNKINIKGFGLGEILLKYPKTPANLLNRGLAYSPAGYVNFLWELISKTDKTFSRRKKLLESFSRASVGSGGLVGIGFTLSGLGLISTTQPKDYDVAALRKDAGLGAYKINASGLKRYLYSFGDPEQAKLQKGDVMVSYDWLQPMAFPLVIGANFEKNKGAAKSSLLGGLLDGVVSGAESLSAQPLLSNLKNIRPDDLLFTSREIIKDIPASLTPTILNQVRQFIDPKARDTYSPNPIIYGLKAAANRLPFASSQTYYEPLRLYPQVSGLGEKRETYQNKDWITSNNIFNVFLNPAYITKYNPSKEAKFAIDIIKTTGENTVAPRMLKNTQSVNGENVSLTPKQKYQLQMYTGTMTRQIFGMYANNPQFQNLPPDKQVSEISSTLSSIGQAGRFIFLKDQPKRISNDAKMFIQEFIQNNQK